jgi:hypothetical protein
MMISLLVRSRCPRSVLSENFSGIVVGGLENHVIGKSGCCRAILLHVPLQVHPYTFVAPYRPRLLPG